jgi:hypothetical protein
MLKEFSTDFIKIYKYPASWHTKSEECNRILKNMDHSAVITFCKNVYGFPTDE